MAKVLIADDHPLFRAALTMAINELFAGDIVETACFTSTLEMLASDDFDLVFLDLNMPGHEGLNGILKIRQAFPNTLCVIISAIESVSTIRKAMQLGASGFIPKSSSLATITQATEKILDGDDWLPEHLSHDVDFDGDNDDFAELLNTLTPTQSIVLEMMANGLLNKQIAYELGISESTVKQHASAVLRKLSLNNRTQAGVLFKRFMEISDHSL